MFSSVATDFGSWTSVSPNIVGLFIPLRESIMQTGRLRSKDNVRYNSKQCRGHLEQYAQSV